jgi:hypothetical protein
MTEIANLNFRIARLRYRMRGAQADIRHLTNAGLDCANASRRLRRMLIDLLALIVAREALACPA